MSERAAIFLAERVRRAIGGLPTTPPVTVSIGVTIADGDHDPQNLLVAADTALYRAKAAGRNRVEFSAPADTLAYQTPGLSERQDIAAY